MARKTRLFLLNKSLRIFWSNGNVDSGSYLEMFRTIRFLIHNIAIRWRCKNFQSPDQPKYMQLNTKLNTKIIKYNCNSLTLGAHKKSRERVCTAQNVLLV